MITYNEQQLNAIKLCVEWYFRDSYRKPIFTIGGLAGTGKSTVVKIIIMMLGIPEYDVLFDTLISKASLVLRLKGNKSNTIHRTFYQVFKNKKSFSFTLKKHIPSNIRLIVLDEFSMINQKMLDDILSFGCPVIALGDPGQLPAIFGSNVYVDDPNKLDVFLTQVMRQDDTSGILDLADMARKGEPIPFGDYKASKVTTFDKVIDNIEKYDTVLCYSNKHRRMLNALVRQKLGYTSIYPSKGEKILCLMNNYNYELEYNDIPINITNGLFGIVTEDAVIETQHEDTDYDLIRLKFVPDFLANMKNDTNFSFNIVCFKEPFDQYQKDPTKEAFIETMYNDKIEDDSLGNICMIDYGYICTTHKSQGSDWNNVLIVNDFKGSRDTYNKWLYTGITRAKKSVTIAALE